MKSLDNTTKTLNYITFPNNLAIQKAIIKYNRQKSDSGRFLNRTH